MDKGVMMTVLSFPSPWPAGRKLMLLNHDMVQIWGCADGGLSINVRDPTRHANLHFETQPIHVSGRGLMALRISWTDSFIEVYVNKREIKSRDDAPSPVVISTAENDGTGLDAIDQPDAPAACESWISWRKTHINIHRPIKSGLRPKRPEEQLAELQHELMALADLASQVRAGKMYLLPKVAASLRALLFWRMGKNDAVVPSYDPLLLRIAAAIELPLPLFAFTGEPESPLASDKATFNFTTNIPTRRKCYPTQELIDLQEWLDKVPVSITGSMPELSDGTSVLTARQIIGLAANKLGGAHFDQDVPRELDALKNLEYAEASLLARYLIELAEPIVHLGWFVVRRFSMSQ